MNYFPDETPVWLDSHKILVKNQLSIPNLHMMGYADFQTSFIKLPQHYHRTMEFTVFLNGTQQYYINNSLHTVHGGQILMTSPNEIHGNNDSFQDICEYVWFQFDMSYFNKNFLGLPDSHGTYLYQQLLQYKQRIKQVSQNDMHQLRQAFFLIASDGSHDKLSGYTLFLQFVINNLCFPEPYEATYSHDIQVALAYIHAHLYEDIPIDIIAHHIGLSSSRFQVKFKNELGVTPHAYIIMQKIRIAKAMLEDPQNSITEISYKLCFSSSNHFSSVFKKYTGLSPSDFRSKQLENSSRMLLSNLNKS